MLARFRKRDFWGLALATTILVSLMPNQTIGQAVTSQVDVNDVNIDKLPYEVLLLKGNLARGRKQYDVAVFYFKEASKRPDVSSKLYLLWARMLREQGDLNNAGHVIEEGLKKFPNDVALRFEQGFLLAFAERWDELEALLAGFSTNDRMHPFAHYLQGQMALARGEYGSAAASFAASATSPHAYQAEAYAGLAAAERARGDKQQVINALQKAISTSKSARQRTIYERQLEDFIKSKKGLYSLRYLTGLQYDSNLNLAPLLFADNALWALRNSQMLQQQVNFLRLDQSRLGLQALVNQTLHFGPEFNQVNDYNSTLLSGELYFRHEFTKQLVSHSVINYDSVFLLFKPDGSETHFSERWRGGAELYWTGKTWSLDLALTPEWSRYYDGNPINTVNDRSTELVDLQFSVIPGWRFKRHSIESEWIASLFNARGDNFDYTGLALEPGYKYNFDPYAFRASFSLEWRDYPKNSDGRQDLVLGANVNLKRLLTKKHLMSVITTYEENLDSGFYGYRRVIVGLSYQGLLVDL